MPFEHCSNGIFIIVKFYSVLENTSYKTKRHNGINCNFFQNISQAAAFQLVIKCITDISVATINLWSAMEHYTKVKIQSKAMLGNSTSETNTYVRFNLVDFYKSINIT